MRDIHRIVISIDQPCEWRVCFVRTLAGHRPQNTDKPPLDGSIVGKMSLFLTPLCFPGTRAIHPDTESRYTEIENVSAPDLLLKVEAEAEEASQNCSEC